MKSIVFAACIIFANGSFAQKASKDGFVHIYYVTDERGFEVAKRIDGDSSWVIDNAKKSLERMYLDKRVAEEKYELALNILKQLNPNGSPKDQKQYNEAVIRYNSYIQQKTKK